MNKNNKKIGSNRNFGIVFFIFFLLVGLWPILNNQGIRIWSILISIVFLVLGILKSNLLSPLNKTWAKLGFFLGSIISPLVMGFIFFFIVTPIGLIMRSLGKDLINLKKNKSQSYWLEKKVEKSTMKKQF